MLKNVSVIILTKNEEIHIERCINSVISFAKEIFVVDSYSSDSTVAIARNLGATVLQNEFLDHASQMNFALDNCKIATDWVMRLDADEVVSLDLQKEISLRVNVSGDLPLSPINGFLIKRRVIFMGRWIRFGGYYPTWLLRLWRKDSARCEQRLMDEHMVLKFGEVSCLEYDLIDENLNSISWWIEKHNNYATKEAIATLREQSNDHDSAHQVRATLWGTHVERKRYLKNIYIHLPLFWRPMLYFLYRFFFRLGFLDGREGLVWHVLQGYWYRFLVDTKLMELKK